MMHRMLTRMRIHAWLWAALVAGMAGHADAQPAAGRQVLASPQAGLRVAVISDLNGSYGSTEYDRTVRAAVQRIIEVKPDVVICAGDMVAGQKAGLDYPAMWAAFHEAVTDPLAEAGIPLAVSPGNHDASGYAAFRGEREEYVKQWRARPPRGVKLVAAEQYPLRYAFTAGPALFVALDATTVGPLDAEQMAWLAAVLKRHGRRRPAMVFGHVPLHPVAKTRETQVIGDPKLEALLIENRVALVVGGHHHAYYPGRRGPLRLVTTGCVGGGPRVLIGTTERSKKSVIFLGVTKRGITSLDAYAAPGFTEVIPRETLPPFIGEGKRRIDRDDLAN
jgi:hypothetical protein